MLKVYILFLFIMQLISGCTSISNNRTITNTPNPAAKAPVYERSTTYNGARNGAQNEPQQAKVITTAALDTEYQAPNKKNNSASARRPVVTDLLAQSQQAIKNQDYNAAENYLKRALRIEPGNAWLWYNMAVINFYQENYHQAIQKALKSNNLEKNSRQLRANNNKIIKQSYIELDEPEKARQY